MTETANQKNTGDKKRKLIRVTWLIVLGPPVLFLLLLGLTALNVFGELPNVEELQNPKSNLASVVFSGDGKILGKYYTENRVNARYAELNPKLVQALIATEDARFYEHSGIDMKALARSVVGVLSASSSSGGGSTITQQLAKMQFPREKVNKLTIVFKKLKEWIIATRLERLYTKEEIITMYLNKFDFLNLAVGIKSASQIYFNKAPHELNTEQCAMLVGMAKNPSLFNPIRRPEATAGRRNVVLRQMNKYGYLSQKELDSLTALPLGLNFSPEDHNDGPAPYFREYLRENFLKKWCAEHINPSTGKPYNIYRDGLKIYTTIDSRMQKYAEEAVDEHMHDLQELFFKDCKRKKNAPFAYNVGEEEIKTIINSAKKRSERYRNLKEAGASEFEIDKSFSTQTEMRVYSTRGEIDTLMTPLDSIRYYKSFLHAGFAAIEPQTGQVKAWVGGINHKHFKYDHVKVGRRQVGSTFKPFVYALAIQEGSSPCEQIPNVRTCINVDGVREWCPDNSGDGGKGENVTLKKALALSINYITAALMKRYGPEAVVNLVKRMGITSQINPFPAICLGTPEISVYEMVGAYCTFANEGTWVEPSFISRIEDKDGKLLEEFVPRSEEIFDEAKAYIMTQLMQGVVQYGTGSRLRGKYNLTNPIAGKTGTTQNNSDGWFMGLTPDLVAGCWVGGEDRSVHFNSTDQGQGASMALPVWGKFFQKIYKDNTIKISKGDFSRPELLPELELDCSKYDEETNSPSDSENNNDYFDL